MNNFKNFMNSFFYSSKSVFKKEIKSHFYSPVAYIVMILFLLVTGFLFFRDFYINGRADLRMFFQLLPFTFSIFIPALTMKLFSEEKSSGSFEMLMTLPLSPVEVVAGKFFSVLAVIVIMILPTLFYVVSAAFAGSIDFGPVIGGYLALILMAGMYVSIGLFFSSLTKSQIAAFLSSAGVCFLLTVVGALLAYVPGRVAAFFQYLSTSFHFQNVAKGVIDSKDLIYFICSSILMLMLTVKSVKEKR